jgi:hypothetical protein
LDQALVLPGLHSQRVIQMVRRFIVPMTAVKDTIEPLSALDHPPRSFRSMRLPRCAVR